MAPEETHTFDEIVRRLQAGDPETTTLVSDELSKLSAQKRRGGGMPDGWYIVRVELLAGGGQDLDPPPGRDVLVSPQHTFRQFAEAINASFARWDLSHLYTFRLADGTEVGLPDEEFTLRDAARTKIARRQLHEVFEYEFDFGDGWTHRCSVIEVDVPPEDVYGVRPKGPVPVWGWGSIPDQYGRTTPDG